MKLLGASLLAFALGACGGSGGSGGERARASAQLVDSTVPEREAVPRYRVVDVTNSGAIVGRVSTTLETPRDSTFTLTGDYARLCGESRRVPLVERRGEMLEDVVVWLADARAGKELPIERRYEITNEDCTFEPRVQAAVEGGMLNVKNADPAVHRTSFLRAGDTVARVRESDAGQVVPTGKVLAHRGLVEVRSESYPWSRAWIRVFDHPYFAVTNRDGIFTIDSVPPGRYRLMAWEPRLGTREREVSVQASADSKVELSF